MDSKTATPIRGRAETQQQRTGHSQQQTSQNTSTDNTGLSLKLDRVTENHFERAKIHSGTLTWGLITTNVDVVFEHHSDNMNPIQ